MLFSANEVNALHALLLYLQSIPSGSKCSAILSVLKDATLINSILNKEIWFEHYVSTLYVIHSFIEDYPNVTSFCLPVRPCQNRLIGELILG